MYSLGGTLEWHLQPPHEPAFFFFQSQSILMEPNIIQYILFTVIKKKKTLQLFWEL